MWGAGIILRIDLVGDLGETFSENLRWDTWKQFKQNLRKEVRIILRSYAIMKFGKVF